MKETEPLKSSSKKEEEKETLEAELIKEEEEEQSKTKKPNEVKEKVDTKTDYGDIIQRISSGGGISYKCPCGTISYQSYSDYLKGVAHRNTNNHKSFIKEKFPDLFNKYYPRG